MALPPKARPEHHISPACTGIVLIRFFLPWVRVSCGGKEIIVSSARTGGILWIVFGSASLVLASYVYFFLRKSVRNHQAVAVAGSIIALATIVYKYVSVARNPHVPFYVPASAIKIDLKPGAFGTTLGLVGALVSALFLKSEKVDKKKAVDNRLHRLPSRYD